MNRLPADGSHEMLSLIFCENKNILKISAPVAVVIGALRVYVTTQ